MSKSTYPNFKYSFTILTYSRSALTLQTFLSILHLNPQFLLPPSPPPFFLWIYLVNFGSRFFPWIIYLIVLHFHCLYSSLDHQYLFYQCYYYWESLLVSSPKPVSDPFCTILSESPFNKALLLCSKTFYSSRSPTG